MDSKKLERTIEKPVLLSQFLADNKVVASKSEARRLVMQGCVEVDGVAVGSDCTLKGEAEVKFKTKARELTINVKNGCKHPGLAPAARVSNPDEKIQLDVWCEDCGLKGEIVVEPSEINWKAE